MTAFKEEHVPLASRIWISVADSSVAILQSLVATSALTYYFVKLRGLDTGLAGIVWLLFGLWNAVNDPLFGYLSDRTKSALGRRLPYIRYGAPIFALGFGLFWVDIPGTSGNQMLMFWQMLVALFIYDSLYTAIATSIYIMPYEMAVSNKARSTIYVWKIIFMVFAIVVPLVLERFKPDVGDLAGIRRTILPRQKNSLVLWKPSRTASRIVRSWFLKRFRLRLCLPKPVSCRASGSILMN
jgi:GPH family glycoside/pentoside/hexuronide:cation symporter